MKFILKRKARKVMKEQKPLSVIEINALVLLSAQEIWHNIYSKSLRLTVAQRWLFAGRVVNVLSRYVYGWMLREPDNFYRSDDLKPEMYSKKPKKRGKK